MADLPRFIFHGNAMPFGGRITKKNDTPTFAAIPGPPAAALSVVGGLSRATSAASNPHPAFSWGATLAEAKGDFLGSGHYQTTVTSSISRVTAKNDPHTFEADVLRVTMVSDHVNLKPASIRITEVVFGGSGGMELDNDRIEVEFNNDLNDAATLNDFEDKYQSNRDFFQPSSRSSEAGNLRGSHSANVGWVRRHLNCPQRAMAKQSFSRKRTEVVGVWGHLLR